MELVLWIMAAELLVLIALAVGCMRTLAMLLSYSVYINSNVVDLKP